MGGECGASAYPVSLAMPILVSNNNDECISEMSSGHEMISLLPRFYITRRDGGWGMCGDDFERAYFVNTCRSRMVAEGMV